MRRAVLALVALVALGSLVLLTGGGATTFRVDAVFNTAVGTVGGQNVDVAGAKVGTVSAVKLIRTRGGGYQALMQMTLARRFMPFHADASCKILPEGIISENYVDCDPGTSAVPLPTGPSGTPTVGVEHTSAPLSLQAIIDTFAAPAPERLGLLIDELGIGTAGRGDDIKAILERADPALAQTNKVLGIVDDEREQIVTSVTQTDEILAQLSHHVRAIRGFVDQAANVLSTTAAHSRQLQSAIHSLPGMLAAVQSSAAPIRRIAVAGTPLLRSLRRAAPRLSNLTQRLPAFTSAALPAVRSVGTAATTGVEAFEAAGPTVGDIRRLAHDAVPTAHVLDELLTSLRGSGGSEALLDFIYALAIDVSSYSSTSHMVDALPLVYPICILENSLPYVKDTPGCSHTYTQPDLGQVPAPVTSNKTAAGTPASVRAQLTRFLGYLLK